MKKLIVVTLAAALMAGCGRPISHRTMLALQAKYPDYELWEQPMVSSDYVFLRHKKDGSVVYTITDSRDAALYAVFGPLK
jgi:hypothetical protein